MSSIRAARVFFGATPTAAVASEVDPSLPDAFRPVTTTRMYLPTSSPLGWYVVWVAPAMSEQSPERKLLIHARHWYVSVHAG